VSRGFADRDSTPIGASEFTFEPASASIAIDTALSELNGGSGITRGSFNLTSGGTTVTVDTSALATVGELVEAINDAGSSLSITASFDGGQFQINNNSGSTLTITNASSTDVLNSLGLVSGTPILNGNFAIGGVVYQLESTTSLSSLNDGNGVYIDDRDIGTARRDMTLTYNDGSSDVTFDINIGSIWESITPAGGGDPVLTETRGRPTNLGQVVDRLNEEFTDQGANITASIDAASGAISFTTTGGHSIVSFNEVSGRSTARDLGLDTAVVAANSTGTGGQLLSTDSTRLVRTLNGGNSIGGGTLDVQTRNGDTFTITLPTGSSTPQTISDLVSTLNADATNAGRLTFTYNSTTENIDVTDTTSGANNLIITGAAGDDLAAGLGISTGTAGVAANTFSGGRPEGQYIANSTLLSSLRGGAGIGTGTFQITDGDGQTADVTIGSDDNNIFDVITKINNAQVSGGGSLGVSARINDAGDGIVIENTATGTAAIIAADTSGNVASRLNLSGTSSSTGGSGSDNKLDGSFEETVTFEASATLDDVAQAINDAGVGVRASIISDGSPTSPFRLSLTAEESGTAGRFLLDTGTFDLGEATFDEGQDARVVLGATQNGAGFLISSNTNTIDNAIPGLSINLVRASETVETISVETDVNSIVSAANSFTEAFNEILDRIDEQTRFVEDTGERGALLGDGTIIALRNRLFNSITATTPNNGDFDRLTDVGFSFESEGRLSFDEQEFREALEQDANSVTNLFTLREIDSSFGTEEILPGVTVTDPNAETTFSQLGLLPSLEELLNDYTSSLNGIIT
ncbi:MAG: flagellar filament capping protein FliD, partial [Planctomycetota bacterium]